MATAATTTMSVLLDNLKTKFLTFKAGTLSDVQTYQRGVIGPLAVFPVIAMLPLSEEIIQRRSNLKYKVRRNIDIEIYTRDFDTGRGFDESVQIIDAVKNILQDNFTIPDDAATPVDAAYRSTWEVQEMGAPINYNNQVLQRSLITLSCVSTETMPSRNDVATVTANVSPDALVGAVKDVLEDNKGTYTNLNRVHTFVDSVTKPISVYPAIFVGIPTGTREQIRPGSDDLRTNIEVHVMTKLYAKEQSLNFNLSIVEDVKDALQVDYMFGGKVENSQIERINYEIDTEDLLYISVFKLSCKGREFL